MKIIFHLSLCEGSTRVGHLYSALVPMLSVSSLLNVTLKVTYIQLRQQLIEGIVQKKGKREREKAACHCTWLHRINWEFVEAQISLQRTPAELYMFCFVF